MTTRSTIRAFGSMLAVGFIGFGAALAATAAAPALEQGFLAPPDTTKPWCYWYWISDNISKEGITRDLEAMKRAGIGEALIGNIYLEKTKIGDVKALTETWWGMVEHAIREGGRIGVDIGLFNCPGWSQSGGPWVDATQTMRHVAMSETRVKGGAPFAGVLPVPKTPFQDLAVLAFPAPALDADSIAARGATVRCEPAAADAARLADGRPDTVCDFPDGAGAKKPFIVELETAAPFAARSLVLHPAAKAFTVDCKLEAKDAAGAWQPVCTTTLDRHNIGPGVGFVPSGPVAVAFPAVTSRCFRATFTKLHLSGGLGEIELTGAPRLERYIEKQLAKMFQDPLPPPDYYLWPPQAGAESEDFALDPARIVNLSDRMTPDGALRWDPPAGEWVVLRVGLSPTGARNSPASPEGQGYEVDKMNRAWTAYHFRSYIGRLLERMPAADRKAFKHVVADSYEMGSQNWTDGFAADFRARYGYDPLPWLPALTGRIVGSPERSDRFLWDLRRLVADRIAYDYVGGLREECGRHGLRLWLENYGHWGFPAEFLQYGGQTDDVGGEFWATGGLGAIELRAASSAAHIYGKPRISAEAFTSALRFESTPWSLKRRGDWALTEGINHWVLHVYIHQPWEDRIPGVNAWFSTEFNRHNTWFEQGRTWVDYYRRCCFLLQQGQHVADVAYFIGEDTPRMTGSREPALPPGHNFDFVNAEVMLDRMEIRDGQWTLPSGMRYRLLVLPDRTTMRPALLKKIRDLVAAGGAVLGRPPSKSPSLQGFPACDAEVAATAKDLWGGLQPKDGARKFGRGRVFTGGDLRGALDALDAPPDVADAGPLLWTHRSASDAEIYFVCNIGSTPVRAAPRFRVGRRAPEVWDPVAGSLSRPACYDATDAGTRVALNVEPGGSLFVVFREAAPKGATVTEIAREGSVLWSAAAPGAAAKDAGTATDAGGTFTMAGWVKPDGEIELPKETDTGVFLHVRRNEAVAAEHGGTFSAVGNHAGAGLSVGRNGVVVFEHGASYYAPVLAHAASLTNWTHVAVVYRDGRPALYLDGRPAREGLKSHWTVHASLGPGRDGGGAFRGERAGMEGVERALSDAELAARARSRPQADGLPAIAIARTAKGGLEAVVAEAGLYTVKRSDGRMVSIDASALPAPIGIEGAWEVGFPAGRDVPEKITLDRLEPLDRNANEAVRHFSGTAAYRTTFDMPGPGAIAKDGVRWYLDLGRVGSMAEVIVNGRNLGVLWKPPFVVDVTEAVKPGANALEVRVTGTWRNRLIGDAKYPDGFPGGAHPPQFKPFLTADMNLKPDSSLESYGLLGPVRLQPARRIAVE